MNVLFASAEVAPFSKTGGLGDVAGALPEALAAQGHTVLVVTPWYGSLGGGVLPYWIGDVQAPFAGGFEPVGIGTLERGGVTYAFVGNERFSRQKLYGYSDDVQRFALFSRSVPQAAERLGFRPDVVHANDWHTGYLPMLLAHGWHLPPGFPGLPSVFTVHNAQFQGTADLEETLWWLRLSEELRYSYLDHFGAANAMQAGIGFATAVTTVSPTYASELTMPEFGFGLDGTFRSLSGKLVGILNGIDTHEWDPAADHLLPRPYGPSDLDGKRVAKATLATRFALDGDRPILGVVSRLAEQKGIDLLVAAGHRLVAAGWSLVLLGTGDPYTEAAAMSLAADHPGTVAVRIGFDEELAHLIYAGSDALAVPSRFEPCGLSQMIAMRYGTLPVVRATGGLRDTVDHGRTGFVFEHASADAVAGAAAEAMNAYRDTARWRTMMVEAMGQDFSWARSAARYSALYRSLQGS
jgi:starch synthase